MSIVPGSLLLALVVQAPHVTPAPPADALHVVSVGSGPAVALIPGLFGSVYGFRGLVPLLSSAGYRVVIVEPLGVGSSARPANADYSLAAQADRTAAALDTFRLGPIPIVAHSLGAAIAFRIAIRHPGLVSGVISIEGGPTEQATTPSFRRAMKFAPIVAFLGGVRLARHEIHNTLVDASGDPSWVTDSVVRGYTEGSVRSLGATIRAFQAMGRAREPELLAPRLHEIQCPVRLLVGGAKHDGGADPEEIELLRRSLASFAVDTVPGVGHYIHEEQPEAVMKALKRLEATIGERGDDRGGCGARRPRS
jgi:pimeloyl-ACP methyl ester carboxylesterase